MPAPFDLERFVVAQAPVIDQVRRELRAGEKRSHWMWFVFPQLSGLGQSALARRYAIGSRDEAHAYLAHPLLGARLIECSTLVNQIEGRPIERILASPDDLKFRSSMSLFAALPDADAVFQVALDKYFAGTPDPWTVNRLMP